MSDALKRISNYEREILKELYSQCTASQQKKFNMIFKSVYKVSRDRMREAIKLCERTVENNNRLMEKANV